MVLKYFMFKLTFAICFTLNGHRQFVDKNLNTLLYSSKIALSGTWLLITLNYVFGAIILESVHYFVNYYTLQTGSESSVDRLMKQISSFMNEISDEFKIVVVQAIQ